MTTSISDTNLARLEQEKRLINSSVSGPSQLAGRYVYRGELALKLPTITERESRPPDIKAEQVLLAAQAGQSELPFFACFLWSFEHLAPLVDVMGDMLGAGGKYFAFCSNIDLASKFSVTMGQATFYVLPLDESTVWNEMLDLLNLDRDSLKKRDAIGKLDVLINAVPKFKGKYEPISYERGLEVMGPVRDPAENRPV